jgi:N-acetylglucosamine malate deacetylase 1
MKINILAFAAHPDDAELACSGILMHHKLLGKTTGIIDITQGELGSRGTIATRAAEAKKSSAILKLDARENLKMPDGFFENNKANKLKIIQKIRQYQPDVVLINAPHDRHPDHGKAAKMVQEACFLSGLLKISTTYKGKAQAHWRPKRMYHYIQDTFIEPDIIVDISDSFEAKIASIQCFTTQFYNKDGKGPETYISSDGFLEAVSARSINLGRRIGVKYGEGLLKCEASLGLNNLFDLVMPKIS